MNESLLRKLKMLRLRDMGHVLLFLLALIPARFYRRRHPRLWLVCENRSEARDNGYWFFKHLCEDQPEIEAVYAIDPAAPERERVASLGETVDYGSFRHWVLYLAAQVNISSQKYGKPNAAVCYLLEVLLGWLHNRRVFLQHGVTKDDVPFLHRDKARLWMFCCAAAPEYAFVRERFGYPPDVVQYVGFCRFDALHGVQADGNLLLILPTWRMYLQRGGDRDAFLRSDYYRCWSELLRSGELDAMLANFDKRAIFVLHREMAAFEDAFQSPSARIEVLSWRQADIAALIRQAGMLVTDYSSVFMDFAYMQKPLAYYQFDYAAFRAGHLPGGYFDYERDGFGPVCCNREELLKSMEEIFRCGCRMEERYRERAERFYPLNDDKNCERTHSAICRLLGKENAIC